jgi:hypothetical protein
MKAMEAKAQAKVAYDVAVTDQIVNKPDSVLALTCFNQAAGVSAKDGGDIFSGDFTEDLTPIVSGALEDFYGDFEDSEGIDSASVDYSDTALTDTFNCTSMEDIWSAMESDGIDTDVPYITFDEMTSGAPPAGAGGDFAGSWTGAEKNGVFSGLNTAVSDLPRPSVPDFSAASSSCEVLAIAGISSGACE